MGAISQKQVRGFLIKASRANKMKAKGTLFEDMVCYIIQKVPGISVTKRNVLNPYCCGSDGMTLFRPMSKLLST